VQENVTILSLEDLQRIALGRRRTPTFSRRPAQRLAPSEYPRRIFVDACRTSRHAKISPLFEQVLAVAAWGGDKSQAAHQIQGV
jgi:hypothetical protein